ncbi:MAG: BON domain-containing protein [Gammaproteobacteria bacterium]|nr:BON domain-containing protein [Gammaproteobacteria bacterium]
MLRLLPLCLACACAGSLSGCALVAVGGAATTIAVANDPRTTGTVIEDQSIELKASNAIADDQELKTRTHLSVTSYNQIVLLTGEAPTADLRRRAAAIVGAVDKVRHVHDEVVLAEPNSLGTRSNDTMLTTKVKTRLFATKNLDATRVKVITANGVVYLMGMLPADQAAVAAESASMVGGVQKVVKLFETINK